MNEMRADLAYLLRELRSAGGKATTTKPFSAPGGADGDDEPSPFLATIARLQHDRLESEAQLRDIKAELKAINDELPRWRALLEAETPREIWAEAAAGE